MIFSGLCMRWISAAVELLPALPGLLNCCFCCCCCLAVNGFGFTMVCCCCIGFELLEAGRGRVEVLVGTSRSGISIMLLPMLAVRRCLLLFFICCFVSFSILLGPGSGYLDPSSSVTTAGPRERGLGWFSGCSSRSTISDPPRLPPLVPGI